MVYEDSSVRSYSHVIAQNYGTHSRQMDSLDEAMAAIDNKHNPMLKKIVNDLKSYPDYTIVGVRGARMFWVLVQHQDNDTTFQKEVLQLMKYAVDYNQASAVDYAYLVDRIRVNTGQKQLYGSQFMNNADTTALIPKPLEDSLNVNSRRAEMGMGTIEKYLEDANRKYEDMLEKP